MELIRHSGGGWSGKTPHLPFLWFAPSRYAARHSQASTIGETVQYSRHPGLEPGPIPNRRNRRSIIGPNSPYGSRAIRSVSSEK